LTVEEKLFWISVASGLWALALRAFLKKEERLKSLRLTALVHALWWGLAGLMAAWLYASYKERPDLLPGLLAGLGGLGFAAGLAWRRFKDRTEKGAAEVLADDLEWADTGFSSILLAAFIMYVFVQAFKIPSGSMEKTLLIGDHLFVNKLIYGVRVPYTGKRLFRLRDVRRGDVVVFKFPTQVKESAHYGKDFIKRAVGLPGDVVELRDKKVFVNGALLEERYTNFADDYVIPPLPQAPPPGAFQKAWEAGRLTDSFRDNFGPVTVPPGHYLVMGDNRDRSYDARFWGPLPEVCLKGKAWFVYWPFKRAKIIR
jgi:signal peptidase I